MKKLKNFDYDKKRPSLDKKYIIQTESEKDQNKEDYIQMFSEPPLIKGMENAQRQNSKKSTKTSKSVSKTSLSINNKQKIKLNNPKKKNKSNSKEKEINTEETKSLNTNKLNNSIGIQSGLDEEKEKENDIDIIITSLPDTEIKEPEEPE